MSKLLDRALTALVDHVPGPGVALIAIAFYPFLGLLVPVAFGWSLSQLVIANLFGALVAALVVMAWLVAQVEAARRRHLVDWTTDLRRLNSDEFEWVVGEMFRREGWTVKQTGRPDAADGNVDLELTRGRERRMVQCKRWSSWLVDVNSIRSFGGALLRERLEGKMGIFVTLSDFTTQARTEAREIGLELVDGRGLFARMEKVRRPEPCPTCSRPMRLSHSEHGWWFRCVTPGCTGKRDIGQKPEHAVEFLIRG